VPHLLETTTSLTGQYGTRTPRYSGDPSTDELTKSTNKEANNNETTNREVLITSLQVIKDFMEKEISKPEGTTRSLAE
jgi:hypothetical protein